MPGQRRHWRFRILQQRDEPDHLVRPTRLDDTELRQMPAQRIDQHRALTDQKIAGPVQHQRRLLLGCLDRHKPHRGPHHRLADRFRVGCIVLLPLHIRLHILRRHQPYLVTECAQLTRPMMRRRAGLHAHYRRLYPRKKRHHVATAQPTPNHDSSRFIDAVDLKHMLRKVQSDRANLQHGRLLNQWSSTTTILAPRCRGGAVHPIRVGFSDGRRAVRGPWLHFSLAWV